MRRNLGENVRRGAVWGIVVSLHAGLALLLMRPATWQPRNRNEQTNPAMQVWLIDAVPQPKRQTNSPHRSRAPANAVVTKIQPLYRPPASIPISPTLMASQSERPQVSDYRAPMLGELESRVSTPRLPGKTDPIVAGFHFEPIPPSFAKHLVQVIGGAVSCGNIAVIRNATPYERASRGISDQELDRATNALGCR